MWNLKWKKNSKEMIVTDLMKTTISGKCSKLTMSNFVDKCLRPFKFKKRSKKFNGGTSTLNDGFTISPERTALISFDDLSTFNDTYHCFGNSNSSSKSEVDSTIDITSPVFSSIESFPSWHNNANYKSNANIIEQKLKEDTRNRRSLLYAFHNARIRTLSTLGSVEQCDDDEDNESAHFSISTDLRYPIIIQPQSIQPKSIQLGEESTSNSSTGFISNATTSRTITLPPPPPLPNPISNDNASIRTSRSNRSIGTKNSTRSSRSTFGSIGNRSRKSLDQFLDERTYASSSLLTGPVMVTKTTNLGELPTDFDAISVGTSASLDVSFHGEYPQLVLTPSVDGTTSRMTGSSSVESNTRALNKSKQYKNRNHRGKLVIDLKEIEPATPTSNAESSVTSFDTTKKNFSCTPQWLNDNIDRVWKQFDQCKTDPEGRYTPDDDLYHDHEDKYTHHVRSKQKQERDSTIPKVNEFRFQFRDGHILEHGSKMSVGADDDNDITNESSSNNSVDLDVTEVDESTDDDIDEILNGSSDFEDNEEEEKVEQDKNFKKNNVNSIKEVNVANRAFSPFDDMVWSFSAGSAGGKSISEVIETEVIFPILKPICELVEATEIPDTRSRSLYNRRLPETSRSRKDYTKHTTPPPYKTTGNASYRMSPRREKPRSRTAVPSS